MHEIILNNHLQCISRYDKNENATIILRCGFYVSIIAIIVLLSQFVSQTCWYAEIRPFLKNNSKERGEQRPCLINMELNNKKKAKCQKATIMIYVSTITGFIYLQNSIFIMTRSCHEFHRLKQPKWLDSLPCPQWSSYFWICCA